MADLYRIDAPHYCAGLEVEGNLVVLAAPILDWAIDMSWPVVHGYFERNGYVVIKVE